MRPARLALSILQNRLGLVPRPSWCTYLVTYRCNARCKMCDSWRMKPGDELTVEQVTQVFGKIGRLDIVRLSGGEPFLRPEMLEIAETVLRVSQPGVIHITTNGSFPDRVEDFARRFSAPRRLRFMVSFDGAAEEHDANRGDAVRFEYAYETCRRLAAVRSERGVEVSANHTVISPRSLHDNEELRATLGALGVEVHSVLAYSDSAMYGAKRRGTRAEDLIIAGGYPLHPKLQGADVVGFVGRELARVRGYRSGALRRGKRYYLRGLRQRLIGVKNPQPNPRCVELRSHIRLLPDGSVPVCQFNTERVGNLLRESFEQVWYSSEATKRSREWVDRCVGCWAECEVMPNAIYTGDLLRG
jgi:MoaA/NifB/PqqE/SkfB family radical SAM enzyme